MTLCCLQISIRTDRDSCDVGSCMGKRLGVLPLYLVNSRSLKIYDLVNHFENWLGSLATEAPANLLGDRTPILAASRLDMNCCETIYRWVNKRPVAPFTNVV